MGMVVKSPTAGQSERGDVVLMQLYYFLPVPLWANSVTSLNLRHFLFNREIYWTYPPGAREGSVSPAPH